MEDHQLKISIHVLPLPPHFRNNRPPEDPTKFLILSTRSTTIGQLFSEITSRYTRGYLDQSEYASFAIKKIQSPQYGDLEVSSTLGDVFFGDPPPYILLVEQTRIDRAVSIPVTTNLRPPEFAPLPFKRKVLPPVPDFWGNQGNDRHEEEEAALNRNIDPDRPLPSSERECNNAEAADVEYDYVEDEVADIGLDAEDDGDQDQSYLRNPYSVERHHPTSATASAHPRKRPRGNVFEIPETGDEADIPARRRRTLPNNTHDSSRKSGQPLHVRNGGRHSTGSAGSNPRSTASASRPTYINGHRAAPLVTHAADDDIEDPIAIKDDVDVARVRSEDGVARRSPELGSTVSPVASRVQRDISAECDTEVEDFGRVHRQHQSSEKLRTPFESFNAQNGVKRSRVSNTPSNAVPQVLSSAIANANNRLQTATYSSSRSNHASGGSGSLQSRPQPPKEPQLASLAAQVPMTSQPTPPTWLPTRAMTNGVPRPSQRVEQTPTRVMSGGRNANTATPQSASTTAGSAPANSSAKAAKVHERTSTTPQNLHPGLIERLQRSGSSSGARVVVGVPGDGRLPKSSNHKTPDDVRSPARSDLFYHGVVRIGPTSGSHSRHATAGGAAKRKRSPEQPIGTSSRKKPRIDTMRNGQEDGGASAGLRQLSDDPPVIIDDSDHSVALMGATQYGSSKQSMPPSSDRKKMTSGAAPRLLPSCFGCRKLKGKCETGDKNPEGQCNRCHKKGIKCERPSAPPRTVSKKKASTNIPTQATRHQNTASSSKLNAPRPDRSSQAESVNRSPQASSTPTGDRSSQAPSVSMLETQTPKNSNFASSSAPFPSITLEKNTYGTPQTKSPLLNRGSTAKTTNTAMAHMPPSSPLMQQSTDPPRGHDIGSVNLSSDDCEGVLPTKTVSGSEVVRDLRPHKCNKCSKDYTRADGLKRHQAAMHKDEAEAEGQRETGLVRKALKDEPPHKCDRCSNDYASVSNLRRHQAAKHDDEFEDDARPAANVQGAEGEADETTQADAAQDAEEPEPSPALDDEPADDAQVTNDSLVGAWKNALHSSQRQVTRSPPPSALPASSPGRPAARSSSRSEASTELESRPEPKPSSEREQSSERVSSPEKALSPERSPSPVKEVNPAQESIPEREASPEGWSFKNLTPTTKGQSSNQSSSKDNTPSGSEDEASASASSSAESATDDQTGIRSAIPVKRATPVTSRSKSVTFKEAPVDQSSTASGSEDASIDGSDSSESDTRAAKAAPRGSQLPPSDAKLAPLVGRTIASSKAQPTAKSQALTQPTTSRTAPKSATAAASVSSTDSSESDDEDDDVDDEEHQLTNDQQRQVEAAPPEKRAHLRKYFTGLNRYQVKHDRPQEVLRKASGFDIGDERLRRLVAMEK